MKNKHVRERACQDPIYLFKVVWRVLIMALEEGEYILHAILSEIKLYAAFAVDPDRHRFVSQTTLASSSRQPSHYSRGDVDPDAAAAADWSPYKLLLWEQENDEIVQRQMALGKRIGFYKFKSDLGTGNFSKVKLATNLLTKGKFISTWPLQILFAIERGNLLSIILSDL